MKIRFNFHSEIPIFNLDSIFQFFNSNFFNFFQRMIIFDNFHIFKSCIIVELYL